MTRFPNPISSQKSIRAALYLTCCLLLLTLKTQAQITLTGTPAAGEYHDKAGITLSPNFSFTASPGQSLHLYIQIPACQPLLTSPGNNQNYIVTYVPRIGGIANPALHDGSLSDCDVMTSIQYFDGLGRPIQAIQVKGSPNGNDIIQPMAYDQYGREPQKYLPYALPSAAANNGSYQPGAVADQLSFYHPAGTPSTITQLPGGIAHIPSPFAATGFEPSPLNRPVEQGAPGDPWQLGGHTVKTDYSSNTNSGSDPVNRVLLWTVSPAGGAAANNGAYYDAGQLYETVVTDEHGNHMLEFKDKLGHVVCKKAQLDAGTYLSTYYVYDDFQNLAYVIPPIPASVTYPASFTEAAADNVFSSYLYAYHYDSRNRLIEKKLPGKDWEYMIYNPLDQVIFSQDGNQRGRGEWAYTKYDGQSRVIMTGIESGHTETRAGLQSSVDGFFINLAYYGVTLWESPGTADNGYTNTAIPSGPNRQPLVINYYDNYGFPGHTYAATAAAVTSQTTGLLTATKAVILNPNNTYGAMLLTENYYDDEGRLREAIMQNNIGGTDRMVNDYNFTGQVTQTVRTHNSSTISNLVITNQYAYDHMGRKVQTTQQTGSSGSPVVISKIDYNEIGQLKTKHLHGTPVGGNTTYLQDIDYTYNERGWLKTSSAPLFAMQLNYNDAADGAPQQFNGNIANQYWGTPGNLTKHYNYTYDALNRLKTGVANNGYSETGPTPQGIEYDYLGNIQKLTRVDLNTGTAGYTYNYSGNQLQTVTGLAGGSTYHYDANGNADHDGHTGRNIVYNYLNLPRTVNSTDNSQTISYTYTASGEKLRRQSNQPGAGTSDYDNGIVYDNGTVYAQTEEGRVLNLNGTINYEYNIADHLGNTRVTFDTSLGYARPVQTNDYFPFGLAHSGNAPASPPNNYLYNRKELQPETNQYDYGARFYDPVIARWTSVDPLAEVNRRWSPYLYVKNNPIKLIDPDGMTDDKPAVGADGLTTDQWLESSKPGANSSIASYFRKKNNEDEENEKANELTTNQTNNNDIVTDDTEANQGGGPKPLTPAQELAKYGKIIFAGNLSGGASVGALGGAVEKGIVFTDKGWARKYHTYYFSPGISNPSGTASIAFVFGLGGQHPVFSDWKGAMIGISGSYDYIAGNAGLTSTYAVFGGGLSSAPGRLSILKSVKWSATLSLGITYWDGPAYPLGNLTSPGASERYIRTMNNGGQ